MLGEGHRHDTAEARRHDAAEAHRLDAVHRQEQVVVPEGGQAAGNR
jgi:hypothetical protein